ncbi:MAG: hypothetical protein JRI86_15715 [Deltaproteobacteria bacterium]|nr:hypothetical protein [Deltaproteobacteria bacterium]
MNSTVKFQSWKQRIEVYRWKFTGGYRQEFPDNHNEMLPFPNLKPTDKDAGIKAAWNYDLRHAGDDFNEVNRQYQLSDSNNKIKLLSGDWMRWRIPAPHPMSRYL